MIDVQWLESQPFLHVDTGCRGDGTSLTAMINYLCRCVCVEGEGMLSEQALVTSHAWRHKKKSTEPTQISCVCDLWSLKHTCSKQAKILMQISVIIPRNLTSFTVFVALFPDLPTISGQDLASFPGLPTVSGQDAGVGRTCNWGTRHIDKLHTVAV